MKVITDIGNFVFLEHTPKKADIIFMPGGSYAELGEKAAQLWNNEYAPLILPSGKYSLNLGYFPQPSSKAEEYTDIYSTEWEFLSDVLIKNGVDKNVILKEDNAKNTYENSLKSREVTDRLGLNINKAIICCKSFHARRCFMYYQLAYPNAELIICPSDIEGISKTNWFTTENGTDKVMGELMRIGSQFKNCILDFTKNGATT